MSLSAEGAAQLGEPVEDGVGGAPRDRRRYAVGVAQIDRDDPGHRRPRRAQGHAQDEGLAGRPAVVVEHEVAEAVGDQLVVVDLQPLDDVGMVAEDEVGARVDGLVCQGPLVGGGLRRVLGAPVEAHDDVVGLLLGRRDGRQDLAAVADGGHARMAGARPRTRRRTCR